MRHDSKWLVCWNLTSGNRKDVRVKNYEPSDGGKDHFSLAQSSEDHDNAEIDRNDADISLKAVTLQKQYLVFNLSETFHSFFSNWRIHS